MIVTKTWLNEWIEIKDISTEQLCEVFNNIGLEVDSVTKYQIPDGVVVGKVISKEPHHDAQKLNVCTVDVGDKTLQIVCGASNVQKDQYVGIALEGAKLPNGLEIKPVKLRGVASNGMICSSTELGLPKMNDGIMVLDESIGKLTLGNELKNYPHLNDDMIELELTANRGDCLSVYGVARDLSVALGRDLKELESFEEDENLLGIGRILSLQIEDKLESSFIYKAIEIESFKENFLVNLRLAQVELVEELELESLLNYVMYSTGVLFRAYDYDFFKDDKKATIHVKRASNGFDGVFREQTLASYTGFSQEKGSKITKKTKRIIVEASYIDPAHISKLAMTNKKMSSDSHYYRSSRGSEPNLEFGMRFFDNFISLIPNITPYGGVQTVPSNKEQKVINLEVDELIKIIGQDIDKNRIVHILQGLGCKVVFKIEQDLMSIKVPIFRHDISNKQDVCEEIVRIVGIDNIASKPYVYEEKSRLNKAYFDFKKRQQIRYKSVAAGFFESVHYVFDDKSKMDKYGIVGIYKKRELSNPLTNELATLRCTLALHLIEAVSFNTKNGKKHIPLFEIGRVFNQKREESNKIAWIFSAEMESPSIINSGKPKLINLMDFATKISAIVGNMSLEADSPENKLFSPYEYANVIINKKRVGYLARVHAKVEREYDILPTYFCEIDFDLLPNEKKIAHAYSKFPTSSRDLSLLVPKVMSYVEIKKCIETIKNSNLIEFFPIDRYESKELGDMVSLSIKFVFQDDKGTLEDEQVNSMIDEIIALLNKKLQITLR